MFDVTIVNGRAVLPDGTKQVDIGISDHRILVIEDDLSDAPSKKKIDAQGLMVLPGLVDMHTHFHLAIGGDRFSEAFETGTRGAIRGGVTTVVDFADPDDGGILSGLEARRREVGLSWCDYAFHCVLKGWPRLRWEFPKAVEAGVSTFKVFTTYGDRGMKSTTEELREILTLAHKYSATILAHAEDDEVVQRSTKAVEAAGDLSITAYPRARPAQAEATAVRKLIELVETTQGRLHVVHISTGEAAQLVADARRRGLPVTGETGPQYLRFDESIYASKEGHRYAACPPFRTKTDVEQLWHHLTTDDLSVVATDSCGFLSKMKDTARNDFRKMPFGISSVEVLLPILVTHGIRPGLLTWEGLVSASSRTPATLCGLYPRKGALAMGSDADVVIVGAQHDRNFSANSSGSVLDFTPYEGNSLTGFPTWVLRGGEVLVSPNGLHPPGTPGQEVPVPLENGAS